MMAVGPSMPDSFRCSVVTLPQHYLTLHTPPPHCPTPTPPPQPRFLLCGWIPSCTSAHACSASCRFLSCCHFVAIPVLVGSDAFWVERRGRGAFSTTGILVLHFHHGCMPTLVVRYAPPPPITACAGGHGAAPDARGGGPPHNRHHSAPHPPTAPRISEQPGDGNGR